MVSNYNLKKSPITKNRIHKIAKNLIEESFEDRKCALEAYRYFKDKVDLFHADRDMREVVSKAEQCMVDCLKLAAQSREKAIRGIEMAIKAENKLGAKDRKVQETTEAESDNATGFNFEDFDSDD
jgi:hypothetical protein